MWILVVGSPQLAERPEGGAATLRDLGCRVRVADLWDPLESDTNVTGAPPAAVLLEALDLVGAGRSALARLRAVPALREVPVLLAVTVNALERLSVDIHGRRVRMKLGTLDPIETVRGVGYKVCS